MRGTREKGDDARTPEAPWRSLSPKDIAAFLQALDRGRNASRGLKAPKAASEVEALALVEKAIKGLEGARVDEFVSDLRRERERLAEQVELDLREMREVLRRLARDEGWVVQGFADYDRAGCFLVTYKVERVTVTLGSERVATFAEANGKALFGRLSDLASQLESFPFSRASFFASVKDGVAMAQALGKAREGRVPVRALHPLVVLCRQNQDSRFLKEPSSKRFTDYSISQFAYDLARFGSEGWSQGNERLVNLPPNMATVAKGATLTIPALGGGKEQQLGALGVQRR